MPVPYQNLRSNTAGNTPASLLDGQLGINQADGRLYYRNSSGVVTQYGPALFAALSHSHGNISNTGTVGSTANLVLVTTTGGAVTTANIGSNLTLSGGTLTANGGGGGGVTDGSKGDIVVSDSGATWTIAANAVVTADIANGAVTRAKLAATAIPHPYGIALLST